jgi:hypothetical protein
MAEAPSSNLGWSTTGLAVGSGRSSQDCRHGVRFPTAPPFLLGSSNGRTSGCYPPNVGSNPTPRANLRRSSNGQDPCFSGTTVGVRISVAAPCTRSSTDRASGYEPDQCRFDSCRVLQSLTFGRISCEKPVSTPGSSPRAGFSGKCFS